MSSDTSILYYTNNLLSRDLLCYTLKETIKHCKNNKCELILTSHYPLSEKYETIILTEQKPLKEDSLYNYLVKDTVITEKDFEDIPHKIFVVGKLPYSYVSIFKQIILSMEKCNGDNIILMEHDCLYPEAYISAIKNALGNYQKEFSYCCFATCFLNRDGYFQATNGSYCLSGCSGKKKLLMEVFKRKIDLIENKKSFQFEPLFDTLHPKRIGDAGENEIIITSHLCIDTFLKGGCVLDIKHNLNADGFCAGNKYFYHHPYWGNYQQYAKLICEVPEYRWNYGITKFNY